MRVEAPVRAVDDARVQLADHAIDRKRESFEAEQAEGVAGATSASVQKREVQVLRVSETNLNFDPYLNSLLISHFLLN